ncbi:MAG: cytochrome c3 family protein [Gemmatimonadota bacterium]|nr:MAG: cytochrome c3 family protein [Gemmatimonadota bacterium]
MRALLRTLLGLIVGIPTLGSDDAFPQESAACLMCHSNPSLFQGAQNPARLVVTEEMHAGSVHGAAGLECTTCHQGFEFPHPEERFQVECSWCHPDQGRQHAASLHGQAAARGDPLAPSCQDCHGIHDVLPDSDLRAPTRTMNIPFLCGECHREGSPVSRTHDIHQDSILQNYSLSIHGEGLFRQGLTVTAVCTSCHTSHQILPHTDTASSIHRNNIGATCEQCHAQIEQVHRQVIEGRLWREQPDVIPVCVDCHQPHTIRGVLYEAGAANQDCFRCHGDPDLVGVAQGDTVSLYVNEEAYSVSEHAGTACAQCHTDVTSSLRRPCETATSEVDCAVCHAEAVLAHNTGIHGRLAAEGDPDAPTCMDCHSVHATLDPTNPTAPTFARNVPELCGTCHRQGESAARRIEEDRAVRELLDFARAEEADLTTLPAPVESYGMSIHGQGLYESGLVVTATCSSCHTAHRPLPPDDLASSVHRDNISATCGTCHHGIEELFLQSIHAAANGNGDAEHELPTCEDCHTSHSISRTDRSDFRLTMMEQCGRCHETESETFFETFHGKVSRLGDAAAAKCYDCHGTHSIHPTSDPRSTLSRRNIVETCAGCHPGANRRFTGYLTHATHHDQDKYPFLFWAFWGMTALLVGTLTFATLHTLAWLYRLWRSPGEWKRHKPVPGQKLYRRFTTFQRSLHLVMLLSFFTLALTGMILKFSNMGWAQTLSRLLGGFSITGFLHRVGAATLIGVFLVHLWDVLKQKRASGQGWLKFISTDSSLMFTRTDLREFIGSMKWFLGRGPRPKYGRYTYWEKFDYFAVFWGMMVIGSTGLLLWFPEVFTLVFPGWWVNVATIIHSDEALLAVGFIFTVHFFNTHFRPDKFPMDPVIFTGRVPVDELAADKPREFEVLKSRGELEEFLVDPYPRKLETAFKIFGFAALLVGLTLIALIVYSMVFGYF